MSKPEIDKEELRCLATNIDKFITDLKDCRSTMLNNKADIFNRYWSYIALRNFIAVANFSQRFSRMNIGYGHNIASEVFQTNVAKEAGWGEAKFEEISFFINQDEIRFHEEIKNLKEKFEEHMKEAIEEIDGEYPEKGKQSSKTIN